MLIVHVDIHVVPDQLDAFLAATGANATASLGEPGVLRFDVVRDLADPDHVVLVEVYRDDDRRRRRTRRPSTTPPGATRWPR